jgi:hypothetical protein
VRRDHLARLGVQLPVLPTIVLGGLPGGSGWAPRLERLGFDVLASGALPDTPATWDAARRAARLRPVKAVAGDAAALAAAGCVLIEGDVAAPPGAYLLGPAEPVVAAVDAAGGAEDPDAVAERVLAATADVAPAELWVAAGPGLERLPLQVVEAKLAALVEGTRRARLLLAKQQFD